MMNRIGGMELAIIIPWSSALLCFLSLKAFDRLFARPGGIYHFIIGLVIASTLMIILASKVTNRGVAAYSTTVLVSVAACQGVAGTTWHTGEEYK